MDHNSSLQTTHKHRPQEPASSTLQAQPIGKHVDKLVLQTNYLPKVFGQGEINWTDARHCTLCESRAVW